MPEAPEVKWVFMVVVIGALYWSKKEKKTKQLMTHRDGDPYGNGRDGDYSNSPYTRGPDGKMISSLSIPTPVYGKPKKRGIHNALNPVASSVPNQRQLEMLRDGDMGQQSRMMSLMSEEDKGQIMRGGMSDKQRVELTAKYGFYEKGKHPDTFRA